MNHSFDIDNAKKYGVIQAILLENFLHWLRVNKANDQNIQDGKVWTYNSVQAYSRLFPYLTPKQIRRAIDSLVQAKAIIKGEYNKANYDKTSWYSVPDESILAIGPKGQMDVPKKANRLAQKGKPIPDINTDINNIVILPELKEPKKAKNVSRANPLTNDYKLVRSLMIEKDPSFMETKALRSAVIKSLNGHGLVQVINAIKGRSILKSGKNPWWIYMFSDPIEFQSAIDKCIDEERKLLDMKKRFNPEPTEFTAEQLEELNNIVAI